MLPCFILIPIVSSKIANGLLFNIIICNLFNINNLQYQCISNMLSRKTLQWLINLNYPKYMYAWTEICKNLQHYNVTCYIKSKIKKFDNPVNGAKSFENRAKTCFEFWCKSSIRSETTVSYRTFPSSIWIIVFELLVFCRLSLRAIRRMT